MSKCPFCKKKKTNDHYIMTAAGDIFTGLDSCMECLASAMLDYSTRKHVAGEDVGKKYDSGKDQWHLVPFAAMREVVKVLGYGAKKYGEFNWKKVDGGRIRYFDAAVRHLTAHADGEDKDTESGFSHLAHAACCMLILLALGPEKP